MLKTLLAKKEQVIDAVVLFFIGLFLLSFFEPALLFLQTTINGGDTGSHYPTAVYLKEVLFPQWKIMGWMQGNYAGFPLFYHYFPLPFILMSFLSFVLPMEIAFKLVSVLGSFLLPLFVYFSLRFLKYEFPIPIIGGIFSLAFLFNQGNSMWGGNIPSTLAGEFCYSLGFALVFLLLGSLYRGVKEQKYLVFNALLVFLTGFSHAYALIFSLIIGSYFLFSNLKQNYKYIFSVYTLGFLFLAFWLLPVLGNAPYTTSFVFRWTINSLLEVFPVILIPFMGLSVAALVNDLKRDERASYFIYLLFACVFVYLAGPRIGVLDIRFVPFFQLMLTIYGASYLLKIYEEIKAPQLIPFIVFIIIIVWVNINATFIRSWIDWNYSGYEQKSTWPIFRGINEFLKNSSDTGRVEWEHTPLDEPLGSIRTYETLPYFAKRHTLEGIHMLGAIAAPFVFYIESETSFQACNPIQDYFYSTFDLRGGIEHFKLFNVSQFVVRSKEVKAAITKYPEFKLEKRVGEYSIYRLTTNPGQYVIPLKNQAVLCQTKDWRDPAYQWFARKDLAEAFIVFKKKPDTYDKNMFSQVITDLSQIVKQPIHSSEVKVSSTLGNETIDIETSEIGHPLLIKVAYHPNWRVTGADRVYLVSPAFMLIFPTSKKIHLSFEPGALSQIGKLLSILGLLLAVSVGYWFKPSKLIEADSSKNWVRLIAIVAGLLLIFFFIGIINPDASTVMVKARRAFNCNDYNQARSLLQKVMVMSKRDSGPRNEAAIFYATTFVREGRFAEAAKELRQFISDYPNSFWTPQAVFDLAYSETNLGNVAGAIKIYQSIIDDFSTTTWAKYSKDRLKEIEKKLKAQKQ